MVTAGGTGGAGLVACGGWGLSELFGVWAVADDYDEVEVECGTSGDDWNGTNEFGPQ